MSKNAELSPVHPCTQLQGDDVETWWKTGVIYQIYPRSFQDSNDDGIGDLCGIERRLEYIKSLGVSAIWVSPFFKSPMKDFGYDVEDHRAVDPIFGSLETFDSFIEKAHALGIRVMLDLVLSHTSDLHPWFKAAREAEPSDWDDCFVWASPKENGDPPNNWLSVFGGPAWTFEPKRNQYYLHNFLSSQPDLNFHNPKVRQEALSVAQFWLERGVDGFRLDTVNFYFHDLQLRDNPLSDRPDEQVVTADNPYSRQDHLYDKNRPEVCDFLTELGDLLAKYPGSIALGEVGAISTRAAKLIEDYQKPGRLKLSYTFDLLSQKFSAGHFKEILQKDVGEDSRSWRCLAFSNHDIRRTATRFNLHDASREQIASLAMGMLLSMRGTPCIYQGEELGLTEAEIPFEQLLDPYGITFWPKYKGRDGCRTPMPWHETKANAGFAGAGASTWLPIPDEHRKLAANLQLEDSESLFHQNKAMIQLHQTHPAFHSERLELLASPETLLAFERGEDDERVLCLFNLSPTAVDFRPDEIWNRTDCLAGAGQIQRGQNGGAWSFEPWAWCWLAFPK